MVKRILSVAVLLIALAAIAPSPASAAPGPPPPGATPHMCAWGGVPYPHGSLRYQPFYSPFRTILWYDIYRCSNGVWVYAGSTDDP